jgi:cyclohexa-1,5-dienecarbonyl-CoA hydratase
MPGEISASPVREWLERDGHLLRLRLSRPKANVIDAAMIAALDAAFSHAAASTSLRAVLLDAEGPHFSFGASVEEHLPATVARMLQGFHALVLRMLSFPVPILVAVRGQCLGGGLEVASAGHVIFTAPDAKFGQPEIQLGVFAPAASCLLPERMGRAAAEDLLLSGRSIDGREAQRLGLVTAVVLDPEGSALGWFDAHLAKKSAASLRHAVAAARQDLVERVKAKLTTMERLYLDGLMKTRDATEGLTAFLEKRPPKWEDR